VSIDRFAQALEQFRRNKEQVTRELGKVIIGQTAVIDQLLAAIFSRGHCLLEGVPGLAKTLLVTCLARLLALSFKRIQFTPDLMPSDITGTNVLEEPEAGRRDFRFVPGPVFAHIVLADEINRTPPKTQSALLQSMQERQVTIGQATYDLPNPFFVIATQNPIEQEGTYPLPEAQLDRFMFNIIVDYPSASEERQILANIHMHDLPELHPVLTGKNILNLQRLIAAVAVSDYCVDYVSRLIRATRPKDPSAPEFVRTLVDWGVSPRAGQYLIMAGKAIAAMSGRFNVAIDDIRAAAVPVLRHRIGTNFQAQAEGVSSVDLIQRLLAQVPVPEVPKYAPIRPKPESLPTWSPDDEERHEPVPGPG
jgi:MoxR-like ATPase